MHSRNTYFARALSAITYKGRPNQMATFDIIPYYVKCALFRAQVVKKFNFQNKYVGIL